MKKLDEYLPYIFHKEELLKYFDNQKQLDYWIDSRAKNERIKKVRNGLYVFVDQNGFHSLSRYEIASNVTSDAFIAYHSALEFFGLANQVYNEVTICSAKRFRNFVFEDIEYINKVEKNFTEVTEYKRQNVRSTSIERTIIDCIDDVNQAGGIEEILNALDCIRNLDEDKLLTTLNSYNKIYLYQKTGYLLENFKQELKISDDFFASCKKKITNQLKYFLKNDYKNLCYHPTRQLIAPTDLKSRIYGGH